MLDAGVGLRDAQIAARHAGLRTIVLYDRARKNSGRGVAVDWRAPVAGCSPPIRRAYGDEAASPYAVPKGANRADARHRDDAQWTSLLGT